MLVSFFTLGCKVNQYETEILKHQFLADGFKVVDPNDIADIYVLNTCTVTSTGDKKVRAAIHHFRRLNPYAVIAVTGCFTQVHKDDDILKEVHVITGTNNKTTLLKGVKQYLATNERIVDIIDNTADTEFEHMSAGSFMDRTRAFVKIEDGCDRYCSYCIIPYARGKVRSKPLDELKDELTILSDNGFLEIVLVGINLCSYGKDIGARLIDAIELACSIDKIKRVRLGSLEPESISDNDILRMSVQPKFCPQFHLALQSGCDDTLSRMNRHYNTTEFKDIVTKLKNAFPNPSFTTDIMVGFPSETETDFAASMAFCEDIGFARLHVFSYSKRDGTKASFMQGQISQTIKKQRSIQMGKLAIHLQHQFLISQIGKSCNVLFETIEDDGCIGYSENYTPIYVNDTSLCGTIRPVIISGISSLEARAYGELINDLEDNTNTCISDT